MSQHSPKPEAIVAMVGLISGYAFLPACGLKGEDLSPEGQKIVTDANESEVTIGLASTLSALPALPLTGAQMTLNAAVKAQTVLSEIAQPVGCLSTTIEGNVVTYTLDRCTGPWGLIKVSGVETATFTPGGVPGKVIIDLQSTNLEVNGSPAEHSAHVVASVKMGTRIVNWDGSYSGASLAGRHVEHTSSLKITIDPNTCVTLDGTTDTKIGSRGLSEHYESLMRCGAPKTCLTGTIVGTGDVSKDRVTLTFDGTTEGLATGQLGGEKSFALDCTPVKR